MSAPRKPIWPQSCQLLPQHLQFRDQYVEALLADRLDAVAPHAWGLSELVVDRAALVDGIFRVVRLAARFPSGAIALVTERDLPLARVLPPAAAGSTAIDVRLGLAAYSDEAPNVGDSRDEAAAVRHRRVPFSRGGSILLPRLQLLCDDEGEARYERMPLARVVQRSGRPALDPEMLPPMLRVLPRSFLEEATRAVVVALSMRQRELVEARRARPLDLRNFHPAHAPQLLLLSAINQTLAVLSSPGWASEVPPHTLYASLTALLGALEGLAGQSDVGSIPAYSHEAPGAPFRAVCDRLLALVPEVARDPHLVFPLVRGDSSTFALTIDDPSLFRRRVYMLASTAHGQNLQSTLTAHAKIASPSRLQSIVQSAVGGVAVAAEFDPPPSFPSSEKFGCFRLDTRSPYWAEVVEARALLMHFPGAPPDLELSLCIVAERPAQARARGDDTGGR